MKNKGLRIVFVCVFLLVAACLVVFLGGSRGSLPGARRTKELAPKAAVERRAVVFPAGEKILFGVYSHGLKAGSGDLTYMGAGPDGGLAHVRFRFNTLSVKDTEDVFGTPDFMYPVRAERHVSLFGQRETITESYADDHKSVLLRKTAGEKVREWSIVSQDSLQNVLLMVYRLRNDAGLAVGKEYSVVLPTQTFFLKVKDKRALKVPLGRYDAFYIESSPAKYRIWISADEKRLPLRIQGLISVGSIYLAAVEVASS